MALVIRCNNGIVTDEYMSLIGKSLEGAGFQVAFSGEFSDALKLGKNEIIVVARTIEAFKLIIRGYKSIIVWFQGIEPEESYMTHHSKLRYFVLSFMEKNALEKSVFQIFVSDEMRRHYCEKYKIALDENSNYIMPCQNTVFHPEAFEDDNKYKNNIFVYTGSMAVWQKFEDTVKAYKRIEDSGLPNCAFWVFTSEKGYAQEMLDKYAVKNYKIDFVPSSKLPLFLSKAKYGFIIRDNNLVNRVATPTKISTYLSCGLIPIYTENLADFSKIAKEMRFSLPYDENIIPRIHKLNRKTIINTEVLDEYERVFSKYYDNNMHKLRLKNKLKKYFDKRK